MFLQTPESLYVHGPEMRLQTSLLMSGMFTVKGHVSVVPGWHWSPSVGLIFCFNSDKRTRVWPWTARSSCLISFCWVNSSLGSLCQLTALQLKSARLFVHGIFGQVHVARHSGGNPGEKTKEELLLVNSKKNTALLFWGDARLTVLSSGTSSDLTSHLNLKLIF